MCRITGFIDSRRGQNYDKKVVITAMRDALTYGGPDDAGLYLEGQLALGHRRLSVLDLSPAGHQPMEREGLVITFNGEVYNFMEVRRKLEREGFVFETGTDTEVILKAYRRWGPEMVQHFRGMFAFALWDKREQKLLLCRDRLGVKPLYWYEKNGLFLFASELKAFHEHPGFEKAVNPEAVSLFLQQGYIPAPHSIFRQARKLEPGSFLELSLPDWSIRQWRYWGPAEAYARGSSNGASEEALVEELHAILKESFQYRMVADVPVGMFLSGGIDSSLVTAILQENSNQPLKTFTIGFEDPQFDEAEHASAIARHLGTAHTELYCTEAEFLDAIPQFSSWYDEPFGDSSGIPTFLVSRLAREQVTVSLSADGGDELFGGYSKYEVTQSFYRRLQGIPELARRPLAAVAGLIDPQALERYAHRLPYFRRFTNVGNKFHKARQALAATDFVDFFNRASTYAGEEQLRRLMPVFRERYDKEIPHEDGRLLSYLGLIDIQTYLEGDILCKVDRATMQVALEGREPFLDHHIVEFALSLPDHYKIRGKTTKYLLRQLLYRYVPPELVERPKQGFAIPVEQWLRTHFRESLREMAQDKGFQQAFGFNPGALQQTVSDFTSQTRYVNGYFAWFLFVLHQWYRQWL